MPDFSYTYDLSAMHKAKKKDEKPHALSSGFEHALWFRKAWLEIHAQPHPDEEVEVEEITEEPTETPAALALKRYEKEFATEKNPEKYRDLEGLIKYAKGKRVLGEQLGADINRDFILKGYPKSRGDVSKAIAQAQEFMEKELSEAQKFLVDQSQGLAAPTSVFFMEHLSLPAKKAGDIIGANMGRLASTEISKEGDLLKLDRVDHFFSCVTNQPSDMALTSFYYKEVGKPIQSFPAKDGSFGDNDPLYETIRETIVAFGKKPKIKVEYPKGTSFYIELIEQTSEKIVYKNGGAEGTQSISQTENAELYKAIKEGIKAFEEKPTIPIEFEGRTFEIEPIASVRNEIQMGKEIDSLEWKTKVIAHTEEVHFKDGIFDKNKKEVKPPKEKKEETASKKGIVPLDILAVVGGILFVASVAAVGGVIGALAGSVIGSLIGGPFGAVLGGNIGLGIGIMVGLGTGVGALAEIRETLKKPRTPSIKPESSSEKEQGIGPELTQKPEPKPEKPEQTVKVNKKEARDLTAPGMTTQYRDTVASRYNESQKKKAGKPKEKPKPKGPEKGPKKPLSGRKKD